MYLTIIPKIYIKFLLNLQMSIRKEFKELQLPDLKETIKEDAEENIRPYVEENATAVSEEYLEKNIEDVKKIVDDIIIETIDHVRKKKDTESKEHEHEEKSKFT